MAEEEQLPTYCTMAHKNLENIEKMLVETSAEIKNLSIQLISAEGYIPRIHERLSIVELSAERAHSRLDAHDGGIEAVQKSHNALAVKVAGLVAVIMTLLHFAITNLP
jgi:chromosome segregation ATPase